LHTDLAEEQKAMPLATSATMFVHRYALGIGKQETTKDLMTYHQAILLEWDHGEHCTVLELAILNAVSGWRCRSNWSEDRDEASPALAKCMPSVMVAPYRTELAEVRCCDVPARNLAEFKAYMRRHTGVDRRFLDPQYPYTARVRIHHRTQEDIMHYVTHYIGRDSRYHEKFRNCQFFAADMYGFLTGKKGIEPFGIVSRTTYKPRTHLFLYDPDMYEV